MKNTFMDSLRRVENFVQTENGATAHKTTLNKVYDLFALGGAYRNRPDEDCILLFKNALEEHEELAVKCLFYIRDVRGGQGERRFFRVCFRWLAQNHPEVAKRNLIHLAEYGRYDDLYCVEGTAIENYMFEIIKNQLALDVASLQAGPNVSVSLLGKWLKSENASSPETKRLGNRTRIYLGLTHKAYRDLLSALRRRINIVERLMSENRWNEIEFDKIPSKAGLIYKNAFAKQDADRYKEFMASKETKVNAGVNYPYEMVREVTKHLNHCYWEDDYEWTEEERNALQKFWDNQKDYLQGQKCNLIGVIDTSGSMTNASGNNVKPIDVAISIGMYAAERLSGPFKNHFITFASHPQLIEIEGIDFVDKVKRVYDKNLVDNTNLRAAFDLIKSIALMPEVKPEDVPHKLVVVSDMEIDGGSYWRSEYQRQTEMEEIRVEWKAAGLQMPELIYWNVDARQNLILDSDEATYVSGCSPVIFESILTGKSGWDLCYEKLMSERYAQVK